MTKTERAATIARVLRRSVSQYTDCVSRTPLDVARGKPASVVILGGGFAGLRAALWLARRVREAECTITLIDREDAHVNPTWLYEVATAFNPYEKEALGVVLHESASVPFAQIVAGTGVVFLRRTVDRIDPRTRTVVFTDGASLRADILVVALGSQLATFGVAGVSTNAFSLKSIHEAVELRHHIVRLFHQHRSATRARQDRAYRVAVVGGGSAGVELAAELIFFLRKLARLHGVDERLPKVMLFEASDTVLREYPPALRARGVARLKALGVQLRTRHEVCSVGADHLACPGDVIIPTETVVWLAGIKTNDLLVRSGFPFHPRGGVHVEPTLAVREHQGIFAAGDCVYAVDPRTGSIAPDVAYAALQQGMVVARNVLRRLRGQPLTTYVDRPRPTLATVGGKYALVNLPPFQFAGRVGWTIKQLVDLQYLCSLLPNDVALRSWLRSVRVRVANDQVGTLSLEH